MIAQPRPTHFGLLDARAPQTLAGEPPVVKSITKDPYYQKLKAEVEAATTLYDRLKLLRVSEGYYQATDSEPHVRKILARIQIDDACDAANLPADVSCILNAALTGIPDDTQYGFLVPEGATVQSPQICDTQMTIEEAVEAFGKVYTHAADLIATGIYAAVPARYEAYKKHLFTRFRERVILSLDPIHNPFLNKALTYGAAALIAWFVIRRGAK